MMIRVLGCHGSQFPGFNTTSFLINGKILLDAGAVTSVLTAEEQVSIDYVLVTHAHLDHVRDITFLADNIFYLKKKSPPVVLSTSYVIDALKRCLFNESFELLLKFGKSSFLRKQESSHFKTFWIPAYAGMIKWGCFAKVSQWRCVAGFFRHSRRGQPCLKVCGHSAGGNNFSCRS